VPAGPGIRIHVAKRGAFAMFAHDHDFEVTRWTGRALLPGGDPSRASVELVLDAGSLRDREPKLSEGDRRKVDAQAGRITLSHDAIPNLAMPKMTMVFRVNEPAMLKQVKAGDKVRFAADLIGGELTVVGLQAAR
jgi:Cu/Ag efflux protein CusF